MQRIGGDFFHGQFGGFTMRLKWCSIGLVTAAVLVGVVWYWHATATSFPWSYLDSKLPPGVNSEDLSWEEYKVAHASWRAYRRLHNGIDLVLVHATIAVAIAAAISLVGWAGQAAIRSVVRVPVSVGSRAMAALQSAPALLGATVLLYFVASGGANYVRALWQIPHPAVDRLREISHARQALAWPLENGMTTAEISAAIPESELKPYPVSEELAAVLQTRPSGYQDTDSSYWLVHGTGYSGLQFRDDRLINFDRREWEEAMRSVIAGTEEIYLVMAQ